MKPAEPIQTPDTTAKPGFFQRIWTKLDESVKEKAESKAKDSCCSGNNKGGKCC